MMKPPENKIFLTSALSNIIKKVLVEWMEQTKILIEYWEFTNTVSESDVPLIVSGQGESTPEEKLQLRSNSIYSIYINLFT